MTAIRKTRAAIAPRKPAKNNPQAGPEQQNIAILKRTYEAWHDCKGADASVWTRLVAPAFMMHSLAEGSEPLEFTARICCPADFDRYFEGLARDWSMNFYRIDRYVAQGNMVVALGECSFTNRHTGKTVITPKVDVFQFLNGKIVEISELYDTAKTFAAAKP